MPVTPAGKSLKFPARLPNPCSSSGQDRRFWSCPLMLLPHPPMQRSSDETSDVKEISRINGLQLVSRKQPPGDV